MTILLLYFVLAALTHIIGTWRWWYPKVDRYGEHNGLIVAAPLFWPITLVVVACQGIIAWLQRKYPVPQ